jgi:hypothetical protein
MAPQVEVGRNDVEAMNKVAQIGGGLQSWVKKQIR